MKLAHDHTRFSVYALRSRQLCDTLSHIEFKQKASSSNPMIIEDFMMVSYRPFTKEWPRKWVWDEIRKLADLCMEAREKRHMFLILQSGP